MRLDVSKITADPFQFISRLKIRNKHGKIVRLHMNSEQRKILEALVARKSTCTLKPRQIGSSTIHCAYLFWRWYSSRDPESIIILSHKLQSSIHILNMIKNFYRWLPKELQRSLSKEREDVMVLSDTGASIEAMSAEASGGTRSFSCTVIMISEIAFAPHAEELLTTALSAVNEGQILIESTANSYGDFFHNLVLKAERGEGGFTLLFFRWFDHKEYRRKFSKRNDYIRFDEKEIMHKYGLDEEQIVWRRYQRERFGPDKFAREYPANLEDAFQLAGDCYFSEYELEHLQVIDVDPSQNTVILDKPDPNDSYAIGCDVASGIGKDYSTIYVVSKATYQPVAFFRSNQVGTSVFARRIQELSVQYNNAKILVESNNYGNAVLNELRHLGAGGRLWKDNSGKDFVTTAKSKIEIFECLKALLNDKVVINIDNITLSEMKSYTIEGNSVIPRVRENVDHHGDLVIALCLAYKCLKNVSLSTDGYLPDFIRRRKIDNIRNSIPFGGQYKY